MNARGGRSTGDEPHAIAHLIDVSLRVFDDCLLPNGCLVAAPSQMPYYPREAKSYLYCWPGRDLGFSLAGVEGLGRDVRSPLLNWIVERAEGFRETGLIYEEYHPNGPRRGPEWQPDQAGTLLWALCRAPRTDDPAEREVVGLVADGLAWHWTGSGFDRRHRDLWERRFASPRHGSNLTYTVAACSKGLLLAGEVYDRAEWRNAGEEMAALVHSSVDPRLGRYLRRFGMPVVDANPDASLIGLVWPFDVVPRDDALRATVAAIEDHLLTGIGVHRYVFDGYDGEVEEIGAELRQGAGAWPLLTFWLAIALNRLGRRDDAMRVFRIGLESADAQGRFPEQRFAGGDGRSGVSPLLWSHMMFTLALLELDLLPPRD
jgi:GH15 family glucan-1,4-alpha-glucosidase